MAAFAAPPAGGAVPPGAGTVPLAATPATTPTRRGPYPAPAVTAGASASPSLTLAAQSTTVGPGQLWSVRLVVGGVPTGTAPMIEVTVFGKLADRSSFDQTVGGMVTDTVVSQSPPIPLASLPTDPAGGFDLAVAVAGDGPPAAGGQFTADLRPCPGGCGGVYPVRLALAGPGLPGGGTALVTHLVYADPPPDTQRLRVAIVVPLALPPAFDGPRGTAPPLDQVAVVRLGSLAGSLAQWPVPLTLAPDPATVERLATSGRARSLAALAQVVAAANAPGHQVVAGPYVVVDPAALVDAGLGSELADQVQRGAVVLADAHVHAAGAPVWLLAPGASLDATAISTLERLGYTQLVVPPAAVTGGLCRLTCTQPFVLDDGSGDGPLAVLSDPGLGARLATGTGALAAHQLLAELALVYFEQPNLDTPRGVVVVAPPQWSPDAAFLQALLQGLVNDPVLEPVTLDTLMTSVPGGTGRGAALQPARRRPVPADDGSLPVKALRTARGRLDAFTSAVSDPVVVGALDGALLTAESAALRPAQQQAAVSGFEAALGAQLAQLSVPPDTIRMTARTARVPITVEKRTPYPVSGQLTVTSDKLVFAGGSTVAGACRHTGLAAHGLPAITCPVTLDRTTTAVYLDLRARASGDFRVQVELTSPRGGLRLAAGQLTIRATPTSAVAIGLSLGAGTVLAVWWGRTLWRSRRGRHTRRPARAGP